MNNFEILHQAACKRQQNGYSYPETEFFVLTEYYLAQRGHCCGSGCRHCPYDAIEQRRTCREIITGTESHSYSDINNVNNKSTTQESDHTEN